MPAERLQSKSSTKARSQARLSRILPYVASTAEAGSLAVSPGDSEAAAQDKLLGALVAASEPENALDLATGFTSPDTGLRVWKSGVSWKCSRSARDLRPTAPDRRYYLNPSSATGDWAAGDDANSGLSKSEPKKNLSVLISLLNPAGGDPAGTDVVEIILCPGIYAGTAGPNGSDISFDCSMVCEDGVAYLTGHSHGALFSLVSGTIYKRATAVNQVISWAVRDRWGAPLKFTKDTTVYASEAAVVAALLRGEWTSYGGSTYIRMPDDSVPSFDTVTTATGAGATYLFKATADLYLEGIRLSGRAGGVHWLPSAAGSSCGIYGCELAGNTNSSEQILNIDTDDGVVILERSRFDHGIGDGINYHAATTWDSAYALELHVGASGNGTASSHNNTTAHDGFRTIRVGCTYPASYSRSVHDINDCESVLIGCASGQTVSTVLGEDVSYNCGQGGLTVSSPKMWLIDCQSLGGGANARDYYAAELSTIYLLGTTATERGAVTYRDRPASFIRL